MNQNQYITETHENIDDFDIEAIEAADAQKNPPSSNANTEKQVDPEPQGPSTVGDETVDEAKVDESEPQVEQKREVASNEPTGEGEGTEVVPDDVNPDDLSDIVGPDGKYMTYREAAKATRSLQSMYDKKFSDQQKKLDELEQQNQQWSEWREAQSRAQQEYQQQQATQQQIQSMSEQQWAHQIDTYPAETIDWASENYPEGIPGIVSYIRQTKGDLVADEMLIRYQQGQQQQFQQQQAEQVQQATAPKVDPSQNIQIAMQAVTEKYGEQFTEMQEDVSGAIQSGNYQIDFADPANIAGAVEHAYLATFREKAIKQNQQTASQPTAASPQAETGNPGQAPQKVSEEEEIADEVVDYWNSNPYMR